MISVKKEEHKGFSHGEWFSAYVGSHFSRRSGLLVD
jgi:hypothetical protein